MGLRQEQMHRLRIVKIYTIKIEILFNYKLMVLHFYDLFAKIRIICPESNLKVSFHYNLAYYWQVT
jgi:hypothetical protein